MNELMTDWWRIIANNILPLPECILNYFFQRTLNHQGLYNSKMNKYSGKLKIYMGITRETLVFTVFWRVFHSILKLKLSWLCRHACRRRGQIILTCQYRKNMPTTALITLNLHIKQIVATQNVLGMAKWLLGNFRWLQSMLTNLCTCFLSSV